VAAAASMKSTERLRAAASSDVGVVAVLALTSCGSAKKSAPGTTNSAPGTASSATGTASSAPVSSATPSTTSLAAASQQPAPAASSASVFGQLTVTGAENLKLTASNVKCEKTVAADGSGLVDITVLTPNTGVGWKLTITSSADSVAAFAAPVTYDLAANNGPAAIQFLAGKRQCRQRMGRRLHPHRSTPGLTSPATRSVRNDQLTTRCLRFGAAADPSRRELEVQLLASQFANPGWVASKINPSDSSWRPRCARIASIALLMSVRRWVSWRLTARPVPRARSYAPQV
jgi:hypothetical protein